MGAKMRAFAMTGVGARSIRELDRFEPAPGDVVVRTRAAAVFTTDRRIFSGDIAIPFPVIGGHEVSGTVVEAEVGADAIKMAYSGSAETFREVTQACCCPVLIQGGARQGCDAELLSTVRGAVRAGGAADPAGFATALGAAIHGGASTGEAPGIPGCVRPATGGDGEDRRG